MTELAREKCLPCRGGEPPLEGALLRELEAQLGDGWQVVAAHHLQKELEFPDFASGLEFVNKVGALAEDEGHHPDLFLTWGRVRITIYTHKVDGLTRSDFILAAKINQLK